MKDLYLGSSNTDPTTTPPDLDFDVCNHTAGEVFPNYVALPTIQEKQYLCDIIGRYVILQIDGNFHVLALRDIKVYAGTLPYSGGQLDVHVCASCVGLCAGMCVHVCNYIIIIFISLCY